GLLAFDAKNRSRWSWEGVVQAQTVASIRTVLPAAKLVPSVALTLSRSFDSSEWNVPAVPSAQESAMVLGWLGSGPRVPRPRTSEAPVSQDDPTVAHLGAWSAASKTAVWPPPPVPFTVRLMLVLWLREPEVPVTATVNVPVVALADAVKVSVELALPPEGGVTEPGLKDAVTPLGRPEAPRPTAELNPLRLETL